VPLQVVKEWLGHRSLQVTLRYAHLAPTNLFSAAEALEAS
jgi:site-specific recombinase XerD